MVYGVINWESFATTVSAIIVGLTAVFALLGRIIVKAMKSETEEVVRPAINELNNTMTRGFQQVAQGMAQSNERIARLEGTNEGRRRRRDDI